jgi:hypothetical protein
MDKIHFIEGDADSAYWAIAGNNKEEYTQGFKNVVKDQEFYDEHVYEWLPDPEKDVYDEKKLLGLAIENQDENCVALAPKCYCLFPNKNITKMKGVKKTLNNLTSQDYQEALKKPIMGKNINLQMKNNIMSKITVQKNALTGVHTKAVVLSNHSCAPFIHDYFADLDYICQ